MKIKAKRQFQYQGKTVRAGDMFDVSDADGQNLIKQGNADLVQSVAAAKEPDDDPESDTK